MNVASMRAACSTAVAVVALGALASPAAAMGPNTHGAARPATPSCPCSIPGGPPGGLPALLATRDAARADAAVPAAQIAPSSAVTQSGTSFDWVAAGVGAGFAIAIGLLGVAGASVLRRRRMRVHVRA